MIQLDISERLILQIKISILNLLKYLKLLRFNEILMIKYLKSYADEVLCNFPMVLVLLVRVIQQFDSMKPE